MIEDFFRLLTDGLFCHPLESIKSPLLTIALALLALDLENPYVRRTKDLALHLLSGIWHVVRSVNESIQNISGSVAKCFKNIVYSSQIQGHRLLSSMARLSISSFERYEYGYFLWAIGAIFGQFGLEKTFVRQYIDIFCFTKGNPYV